MRDAAASVIAKPLSGFLDCALFVFATLSIQEGLEQPCYGG